MKYLNLGLLLFVVALAGVVVYLGMSGGWAGLFIFPVLIICGFVIYYLHFKFEKEEKEVVEKEIKLAREDNEAEEWIKDTLVPSTIIYGKQKQGALILYFFLLTGGLYFLWSYISGGLNQAIKDLIYGSVLFWIFILYVLYAGRYVKIFVKIVPLSLRKISGIFPDNGWGKDWLRAYFFLLPITTIIYLLYPLERVSNNIADKLFSVPGFFLIYTFLFLSLYSVVYIKRDIQKEDKEKLEKEVKELL